MQLCGRGAQLPKELRAPPESDTLAPDRILFHAVLTQSTGDISCPFSIQQTVCSKHETNNQEEDLDCAALWQGRKEEEDGCAPEDVDCSESQKSEAEGERCWSKEQEVDQGETRSTNTHPEVNEHGTRSTHTCAEEDEDVLDPLNSFHDDFALDELIQARSKEDE